MSNQDVALAEEITVEEDAPATVEATPPEIAKEPATNEENELTPVEAVETVAETDETTTEDDMSSIHDLEIGQRLTGVVKNIADFGAFVDVGIPQDGLVHISKLAKHKVEKVSDVVSQGQEIEVWVKKVDTKRGRLSLTMIKPVTRRLKDLDEGAEIEGTVTRLESYGAFVDIESDRDGLIHISQITHEYIKHPEEALKVGDTVKVKVLNVNRKKRQIDLSIKALLPPPVVEMKEEKPVEPKAKSARSRSGESKAKADPLAEMPIDDQPQLTAMAVAIAALQDKDDDTSTDTRSPKEKKQTNNDIDEIIARTLASHKE